MADVIGWVPRAAANAVQRAADNAVGRTGVDGDCCCGCDSCPDPCDPATDFPAWYDLNATATLTLPTGCLTDTAPTADHTPDTANYGLRLLSTILTVTRTYRVCKYVQDSYTMGTDPVDYALYHCTLPLATFFDFVTYSDDTTCTTPTVPRLPLLLFPTVAVYYHTALGSTTWDLSLGIRHPGWNLVSVFAVPPAAAPQYVRPWQIITNTGSVAGAPNAATIGGTDPGTFGYATGSLFATPCGLV